MARRRKASKARPVRRRSRRSRRSSGARGKTLRFRYVLTSLYAADQVGMVDAVSTGATQVTAGNVPDVGGLFKTYIRPKLTASNLIKTAVNSAIVGTLLEFVPKKTIKIPEKVPLIGGTNVGF